MDTQYDHRGLAYSHNSDSALQTSGYDQKEIDMVLSGVEWALASKPEEFAEIPETSLRLAKTFSIPMRMYFAFDDSMIDIVHIEFD